MVVKSKGKVIKMEVIESGGGVEIGGEEDGENEKWGEDRWTELGQPAELQLVVEHDQISGKKEVSWGERKSVKILKGERVN